MEGLSNQKTVLGGGQFPNRASLLPEGVVCKGGSVNCTGNAVLTVRGPGGISYRVCEGCARVLRNL